MAFDTSLIGGLTAAGALAGVNKMEVEQSGASAQTTLTALAAFFLASSALTGTPTAPTAAPGTNTTQVASTAFSAAAVAVETAARIADVDAEESARIAADALKANLASPTFTGVPAVPTAAASTNTTQAASTAFVQGEFAARPGMVVGSVVGTYDTNANITTVIDIDDSIPQIGEGTEIISVSITPKTTSNKLRATFRGTGSTAGGVVIVAALFAAGGSNAIAGDCVHTTSADRPFPVGIIHEWVPGVTTAVTVAVRVGPGVAGTLRMNGISSARRLGGVMHATLVVEEIQA